MKSAATTLLRGHRPEYLRDADNEATILLHGLVTGVAKAIARITLLAAE